jgi:ADP-heptose:LPS heptosyltransferase
LIVGCYDDSPLVIFHKQLGDVLLLEPALSKLAQTCRAPVMLATRPEFAPLLSLMHDVVPMPERFFRRASQVISFDPRLRACIQATTTWAPEKRLIVTRPRYLRSWHRLFFPAGYKAVNETDFYRAEYFFNVIPGGALIPFRPPLLKMPASGWKPAALPPNYVLLHATSAWPSKSWPVEHWARVLDSLHTKGIGPFVITGGKAPWESDYVGALQAACKAPLLNLSGQTGLNGYLATVAYARLVLCIDGSAAHLAAAFRRPSLTLFGPSHPIHWHYPALNSLMIDARCFVAENKPAVTHIPVGAVIEACCSLWDLS